MLLDNGKEVNGSLSLCMIQLFENSSFFHQISLKRVFSPAYTVQYAYLVYLALSESCLSLCVFV